MYLFCVFILCLLFNFSSLMTKQLMIFRIQKNVLEHIPSMFEWFLTAHWEKWTNFFCSSRKHFAFCFQNILMSLLSFLVMMFSFYYRKNCQLTILKFSCKLWYLKHFNLPFDDMALLQNRWKIMSILTKHIKNRNEYQQNKDLKIISLFFNFFVKIDFFFIHFVTTSYPQKRDEQVTKLLKTSSPNLPMCIKICIEVDGSF